MERCSFFFDHQIRNKFWFIRLLRTFRISTPLISKDGFHPSDESTSVLACGFLKLSLNRVSGPDESEINSSNHPASITKFVAKPFLCPMLFHIM